MKKLMLPVLAALLVASCTKENIAPLTNVSTDDETKAPVSYRMRFETSLPTKGLRLTANGETVTLYETDSKCDDAQWAKLPVASNGRIAVRLTNDKDVLLSEGIITVMGGSATTDNSFGELRAVSDGRQRLIRIQLVS